MHKSLKNYLRMKKKHLKSIVENYTVRDFSDEFAYLP